VLSLDDLEATAHSHLPSFPFRDDGQGFVRRRVMLDHALNVPLRFLSNTEIEEIANGGVQEDGNIEFKSALDEGSDADRNSWADGGRLARSAKADLIKAVISFANAYGGTLYLGVKESDDDPKRSAVCP